MTFRTVLALSPHADDAELGAGGTIARLAGSGSTVYCAPLSFADQSGIEDEFRAASKILHTVPLDCPDYPRRQFSEVRQTILDYLLALERDLMPGLVFVPAQADVHQDHRVVTDEALRAFRHTTVLGYELPYNHIAELFRPSCLAVIGPDHLSRKQAAAALYKSQAGKPYADVRFLQSLARVRGLQAGADYAEAFEVLRWIL